MLPSPDVLNEFEHGKFVLSNLAAKRAKQLREGAPPLVRIDSPHPLTIALAEIAAGKIKPVMPDVREAAIEVPEVPILVSETVPSEFGLLLPALDETEAALVGTSVLVPEEEHEAEAETVSLQDLVAATEEEEPAAPAAPAGEEEPVSLTEIAEEETSLEEEDTEE